MVSKKSKWVLWIAVCLFVLGMGVQSAMADKAPRMTKEELKAMMANPDLIILDVRTGKDWDSSQSKIQGAVRENPQEKTKSWAEKYSKDKTIVLYCA